MLVAIQEINEAGPRLSDLVKQVEAGDEVILTRNGCRVARLIPEMAAQSRAERRAVLEQFQHSASSKATSGPSAARSQDFLYGDDGMPV